VIKKAKIIPWDEHYKKAIWNMHFDRPNKRGEWACIFELRLGTGYGSISEKRIDIFVINCFPSKSWHKIAYEIKRTRKDFFNEINYPLKRHPALMFSNQFFFVTPPNLIKTEELPQEAGLIEVNENRNCIVKLIAPYREAYPPVWPLFASVARRLDQANRKLLSMNPENTSEKAP